MSLEIKKEDKCCFSECGIGTTHNVRDSKTTLHFTVENKCYKVKVDGGIVKNTRDGIKKCDYLLYDENSRVTHLIELKGEIIERAYLQLESTVDNIKESDYPMLLQKLKFLDAYIVSPLKETFPRKRETKEKDLLDKLRKVCGIKKGSKEVFKLIKYVRIIPNEKFTEKDNRIICSGKNPMMFKFSGI